MSQKMLFLISLLFLNSVTSNIQSLAFLSDALPTDPYHPPTPEEWRILFTAIIKGLKVFNDLPHEGGCQYEQFKPIIDDIKEIVALINKGPKNWQAILDRIQHIADTYKSISGPCGEYIKEIGDVLGSIKTHVMRFDYFMQLPVHIAMNYQEISRMNKEADQKYLKQDYQGSGELTGATIHLALLWDYKK
jgi:hypothetical protein